LLLSIKYSTIDDMGKCKGLNEIRGTQTLAETAGNLPKGGGMSEFMKHIFARCKGKIADALNPKAEVDHVVAPKKEEPKKPVDPKAEKPKDGGKDAAKKEGEKAAEPAKPEAKK
jgi:hypothetical protein